MLRMTCSDLKKFLPRLPRRKTILVGLAVWVCAVLILLWQLEQVALVQIIITASVGGLGLYVGLRQLRATEKSTSVAQANVRVAQEGHLTEGFTQAIEHLGSDKIEIRVGGIYALERIAKDSEKDHGPIMEVLTAYVRERAPRREENTDEPPPADIQAILTVFGRRKTTGPYRRIGGGSVEGGVPGQWQTSGKGRGPDSLDLNHTHLVGAELISADLTTANLAGANLSGATLVGANLTMATLAGANLYEAKLYEADLTMADLNAADLSGANLDAAELILAALTGAKNLTAEQVLSAKNWRTARLPKDLQYLLTGPPETSSAPSSTN